MKIESSAISFKTPVTLLGVLLLSSGLSCAVVPDSTPEPVVTPQAVVFPAASEGVLEAYANFQKRDFAAAAAGYSKLAMDGGTSATDRQLAHLGKALVHLSTDTEWRDVAQAGVSLQAAEAIEADSASVENGMLMTALSSLIGVETNMSELNTKVANSSAEIAKLKDQNASMQSEQDALNEALEKLKALTIGN